MAPRRMPDHFNEYRKRHTQAHGYVTNGGKIKMWVSFTPRMAEILKREAWQREVSVAAVIRDLVYAGLKEEDFE